MLKINVKKFAFGFCGALLFVGYVNSIYQNTEGTKTRRFDKMQANLQNYVNNGTGAIMDERPTPPDNI